jgi:hypothetical protein
MLRAFQRITAVDNGSRLANAERLRELVADEGDRVRTICSHDPFELDLEQARDTASESVR